MRFTLATSLLVCLFAGAAFAAGKTAAPPPVSSAVLTVREIRYDARLSADEARFTVSVDAEAAGKGECSAELFEGDIALLPGKLPDALKIVREGNRYRLIASRAGQFKFKVELVARIERAEP